MPPIKIPLEDEGELLSFLSSLGMSSALTGGDHLGMVGCGVPKTRGVLNLEQKYWENETISLVRRILSLIRPVKTLLESSL